MSAAFTSSGEDGGMPDGAKKTATTWNAIHRFSSRNPTVRKILIIAGLAGQVAGASIVALSEGESTADRQNQRRRSQNRNRSSGSPAWRGRIYHRGEDLRVTTALMLMVEFAENQNARDEQS